MLLLQKVRRRRDRFNSDRLQSCLAQEASQNTFRHCRGKRAVPDLIVLNEHRLMIGEKLVAELGQKSR
jgi:hypothetical protein